MTTPWIEFRPERPNANSRVLCVPYAGASTQVYAALARSIPEEVEFAAVQLPGRWNRWREPLLTKVTDASQSLAAELTRISRKPYVLFGYSLGGLIAFETARILASDTTQQQPRALIVAASRAPTVKASPPFLHRLPDSEFIKRHADRYPGEIPKAVFDEPDVLAMLLPVLKADMEMFETYQYVPSEPLQCPLYTIAGEQDPLHPPSSMAGWQTETTGKHFPETVAGGHFFINSAVDRLRGTILRALQ
jgi:medium-chain acyl-[acyl-carrier-protein] hydrolase